MRDIIRFLERIPFFHECPALFLFVMILEHKIILTQLLEYLSLEEHTIFLVCQTPADAVGCLMWLH